MVLVLHNIRSVYNVGSIFRTADAAGISSIILSGYTPTPLDHFGMPRKDFAKVSLGAEKTVQWMYVKTIGAVIKKLKKEKFYIVALEQDKKSTSLFKFKRPKRPFALIVGNEVRGISKAVLKQCDAIVEIPMRSAMVRQAHHPRRARQGKESLNVSVAAGVAVFVLVKDH